MAGQGSTGNVIAALASFFSRSSRGGQFARALAACDDAGAFRAEPPRSAVWTGATCVVAWDLRGDVLRAASPTESTIYDVLDPAAASVGLRASSCFS